MMSIVTLDHVELKRLCTKIARKKGDLYELRAILERLAICHINEGKDAGTVGTISTTGVSISAISAGTVSTTDIDCKAKFVEELGAERFKKLAWTDFSEELYALATKRSVKLDTGDISTMYTKGASGEFRIFIPRQNRTITIPAKRMQLYEARKIPTAEVIHMAIRYDDLHPQGQQWEVPRELYRNFVAGADPGTVYEAFASPLNSVVMTLGPDYRFCSIFTEDLPFGSIGSFFAAAEKWLGAEQDVLPPLKVLLINPPFIESTLLRAAEIATALARRGTRVLYYGPMWKDAKFYELLSADPLFKQSTYTAPRYGRGVTISDRKYDSVLFTAEYKA